MNSLNCMVWNIPWLSCVIFWEWPAADIMRGAGERKAGGRL